MCFFILGGGEIIPSVSWGMGPKALFSWMTNKCALPVCAILGFHVCLYIYFFHICSYWSRRFPMAGFYSLMALPGLGPSRMGTT